MTNKEWKKWKMLSAQAYDRHQIFVDIISVVAYGHKTVVLTPGVLTLKFAGENE